MNHLKIRGLAVLAAAAAVVTVLVGAGTAEATVFCSTTSTPCNQFKYKTGVSVDANLTNKIVFETIFGDPLVECAESTIKGKIAHEGSATETVLATIEKLTWGKCTGATATVTNGFYEVHHITGTDNGTVTGGSTEVTVNVGFDCIYSTEGEDLGTLKGGAAATLEISTTLTKTGGNMLCPLFVAATAVYKFAEPLPLYVEAE